MTVTAELAQRQEEILERIKSLELTVGSSASSSIPSGADARVKDLAVRQIRIIARLAAIELQLGVGIGAATGEEHASLEEDVPCAPPEIFDDQDPALTERLHTELLSRNVMKVYARCWRVDAGHVVLDAFIR